MRRRPWSTVTVPAATAKPRPTLVADDLLGMNELHGGRRWPLPQVESPLSSHEVGAPPLIGSRLGSSAAARSRLVSSMHGQRCTRDLSTRPTARHASSASPGRIMRLPRAELGWWSSSVRPRPRIKSPLRPFHARLGMSIRAGCRQRRRVKTPSDAQILQPELQPVRELVAVSAASP